MSEQKINQIKGLLAIASVLSSNEPISEGVRNEALVAQAKAQKLMVKYGIAEAQLKTSEFIKHDFEFSQRLTVWHFKLLTAIAKVNFCQALTVNYKGQRQVNLRVAGATEQVKITLAIYQHLKGVVNEMATCMKGTGRANVNSYKMGLAMGIATKLLEAMERSMKEDDLEDSQTTALVVRDAYATNQEKLDEFLGEVKKRDFDVNYFSRAFRQGFEKGYKADLSSNKLQAGK